MRNPIIFADYPDPDVICVGDIYYMCTTTMHTFPGGEILCSRDLLHWEHCSYAYNTLGEHPGQRLDEGRDIYGQGMWAGSLRYHQGLFHLVFMCNDTRSAYHFTAENPKGPWVRRPMAGFYHDPSVLFDDDGRVYMAYGNRDIRLTEMESDLSAPKPGGLDRVILHDDCDGLGWEGSHLYKVNGKYCWYGIHWPKDSLRAQGCYMADSLEGEFTGGEILCQPFDGRPGDGPAQGGMVQTPEGDWYLMLFQDHGAVGRIPVLVPMTWEHGFPRVEGIPTGFDGADVPCAPLMVSQSLHDGLHPAWQWNHEPHWELIHQDEQGLRLQTDRTVDGVLRSVNTLTQRTFGPGCTAEVTVDGAAMNPGDFAGLCALQGMFGQIGLTRTRDGYALSVITNDGETAERARLPWKAHKVHLRAAFDFTCDRVRFFYWAGSWQPLGEAHQLVYRLDHFMGVRVGLYCYSTEKSGGSAVFADFVYGQEDKP